MVAFELDRAFPDFNFSEFWDPALRDGPSASSLYKLVYKARKGDRFAPGTFANAMYCTLRPETWECFQRSHGFRPVSHRDWFFAKLVQFLDILVYDELTIEEPSGQPRRLLPDELLEEQFTVVGSVGPLTQENELEQALVPQLNDEYDWYGLVQRVLGNPADRAGAVQAWLMEQRKGQDAGPTEQARGGWRKNQERDQIILNSLNRGMEPEAICDLLDKHSIPPLPAMEANEIQRWKDGWDSLKTRNAIEQLFSKLPNRKKRVKPLDVSK